ncbi:MAG TPA: alkaline phosphatase, partial [Firmicutes bacterium]|nr:alkaline phosphatase [Bacillota bacterium]
VEIAKAINQRALIGFTSSAHTAVNVPVMALGPRASLFSGLHDNTEIARLMAEALKVTLD